MTNKDEVYISDKTREAWGKLMKTLKEKSQEFIELRTKITQGNWGNVSVDVNRIVIVPDKGWGNDNLEWFSRSEANLYDFKAMCQVPEMIAHIKALQEHIDYLIQHGGELLGSYLNVMEQVVNQTDKIDAVFDQGFLEFMEEKNKIFSRTPVSEISDEATVNK